MKSRLVKVSHRVNIAGYLSVENPFSQRYVVENSDNFIIAASGVSP